MKQKLGFWKKRGFVAPFAAIWSVAVPQTLLVKIELERVKKEEKAKNLQSAHDAARAKEDQLRQAQQEEEVDSTSLARSSLRSIINW